MTRSPAAVVGSPGVGLPGCLPVLGRLPGGCAFEALRLIWHQRSDRVRAHIFVCFLAYVLWKTLERWQDRAGLGHSPRTVLHELRRIQSTDVVLTTVDGREMRLRCVVRPDKAQAAILDRLGLILPQRLRAPENLEM